MNSTISTALEQYFLSYRKDIIGINQAFVSPYGKQKLCIQIGLQVEDCMGQ